MRRLKPGNLRVQVDELTPRWLILACFARYGTKQHKHRTCTCRCLLFWVATKKSSDPQMRSKRMPACLSYSSNGRRLLATHVMQKAKKSLKMTLLYPVYTYLWVEQVHVHWPIACAVHPVLLRSPSCVFCPIDVPLQGHMHRAVLSARIICVYRGVTS